MRRLTGFAGRQELQSFALAPWANRRRQDLLDLLDQLTPKIQELTRSLEEEVEKRPAARRLMTHPGVGPLTALLCSVHAERCESCVKTLCQSCLTFHRREHSKQAQPDRRLTSKKKSA